MSPKRIDPIRILIIIVCLLAIIAASELFSGCTKRQEATAKTAGAVVAGLFGLPPGVGETLVASVIAAGSYFGGKTHGRRSERRRAKPAVTP